MADITPEQKTMQDFNQLLNDFIEEGDIGEESVTKMREKFNRLDNEGRRDLVIKLRQALENSQTDSGFIIEYGRQKEAADKIIDISAQGNALVEFWADRFDEEAKKANMEADSINLEISNNEKLYQGLNKKENQTLSLNQLLENTTPETAPTTYAHSSANIKKAENTQPLADYNSNSAIPGSFINPSNVSNSNTPNSGPNNTPSYNDYYNQNQQNPISNNINPGLSNNQVVNNFNQNPNPLNNQSTNQNPNFYRPVQNQTPITPIPNNFNPNTATPQPTNNLNQAQIPVTNLPIPPKRMNAYSGVIKPPGSN